MGKEGKVNFFDNQGKANIAFFLSLVFIFIMMLWAVNAITIRQVSPGNFTYNDTATRNINFTFNVTWDLDTEDATGNCSIWIYSTTPSNAWQQVAVNNSQSNISNWTTVGGLTSWINYTFTADGNYTWAVACTNASAASGLTFSSNFTFTLDTTVPVINITFNTTLVNIAQMGDVINFTANISDNIGLLFANITFNTSGVVTYANYTISGTSAQIDNVTTLSGPAGSVINFTMYVTDTNNHVKQNSTLLTIDNTMPVVNTTFNTTLVNIAQMGDVINFTANITDNLGLLFANITYNISGSVTYNNFTFAGGTTSAEVSNFTTLSGPAGSVINFTMYVTDTSNNVKQNSTLLTIDNTMPVVNTTFNISSTTLRLNDVINFTGNITENLGLLFANITYNMSGVITYANYTFAGGTTSAEVSNVTRITTGVGSVINFTMYVTDTSNNVKQNSTVFTVADNTTPTLSVTLDLGSAQLGTRAVNGTNTTDTTPTIVWNVTESIYDSADWSYIAIDVDNNGPGGWSCNLFVNYTTVAMADANSNGSITVKGPTDQAGCNALTNGTHTVRLTTLDASGNTNLYIHTFVVQTGEDMNIVLGLIKSPLDGVQAAVASVNQSNITPYNFLVFNATLDGGVSTLKNMTWVSSCQSTVQAYTNATGISPFNYSGCKGVEANFSINMTLRDHVGNSITRYFQFAVDDLAPSLAVNSPTNGYSTTGLVELNVSALDQMNRVDRAGFYLDGSNTLTNHSLNATALNVLLASRQGENVTYIGVSANFTAGTHTIKFMVNDSLGNVRNSSVITFTYRGPFNFLTVNQSLYMYYINYTNISVFNSSGDLISDTSTPRSVGDETLELFLALNSSGANINVSINFNGSAANWDAINFSVEHNDSRYIAGIQNNFTATIVDLISFNTSSDGFTDSIDEFLTDSNSYYGFIDLTLNATNVSGTTGASEPLGGATELWYFSDETALNSKVNITECKNIIGTTAGYTHKTATSCWNNTLNVTVRVYVPHFSAVALVNDTTSPTVTKNTPASAQGISGFIPNITVSFDAVSCGYAINGTDSSASSNVSSSATAGLVGGINICTWPEIRFKDGVYNITYNATDANGNINVTSTGLAGDNFTVSDSTAPDSGTSITDSGTTTGATITISGVNESVNVTVAYGTTNTSLTSTAHATDFESTQIVTISGLSTVTTATVYYYNVTVCDFNNNCKQNTTVFTFTQSATAAAAAAATTTSSGGGGAVPVSTVADSKGQVWSTVPAGSSFSLDVNKATIAITSVAVNNVKAELKNVDLEVQALKENPVSVTAAGKVNQYLRINKKNVVDTDAESLKIGFRVTKAWLTENGLTSADVRLYRYNGGVWNKLITKVTGTDSTYVNFEAETPGFSYFAVGSSTGGGDAFAIIDSIREFYAGTSSLSAFDIIDMIRAFYG